MLSEVSTSPTLAAERKQLLADFPKAVWVDYEPVWHESGDLRTHLDLDKAEVIVALDADLFGNHPAAVTHARDFAAGRGAADGQMSRLYAVESCYSLTGAMADHRLPIPSGQISSFAKMLRNAIDVPDVMPGGRPASRFVMGGYSSIVKFAGEWLMIF